MHVHFKGSLQGSWNRLRQERNYLFNDEVGSIM